MKILHFLNGRCNPDGSNGVDKTVYYLSRNQARLNHEVSVVGLSQKPIIPIEGVRVMNYPPERKLFHIPKDLISLIRTSRPDIVHLHSVYLPCNISLASKLRRLRIPYFVTPNGGYATRLFFRRIYLKIPFMMLFERTYLNRAAFIHAVGESEEKDIRRYGIRNRFVQIPNGIDLSAIPKDVDSSALPKRFLSLGGKRVFLFLGRLDPVHKGLDLLIQAFAKTKEAQDHASLVIVGPDWNESLVKLKTMAAKLGVGEKVIFTGPIYGKEKYDILASADFFIHTSRWEGLPFSVLEALSIGKPCIVTPHTNMGRYIKKYNAGWVVSLNANNIAKTLDDMATISEENLIEMGLSAKSLIREEFQWEIISKKLVDVYKKFA